MKTLLAFAVIGAGTLMAGPAAATTNCPKALQFFGDDTGVITWQKPRLDSPLDSNKARLATHVLGPQDGDDFAGAFNNCTGIEGRKIEHARNLSFDFLNSTGNPLVHTGAGSPALVVILDLDGDGSADDAATLSAFHCQEALIADSRWSRTDYTGRVSSGCLLFLNSNGTTPAAQSDGSTSAWDNLALAFPSGKVVSAFFLVSEEGTAFVDRIAMHNRMFIAPGADSNAVKNCPSESSC